MLLEMTIVQLRGISFEHGTGIVLSVPEKQS